MLDLSELSQGALLALGRQALEACIRRFDEIAQAVDPTDRPLQDLLRKMASDTESQAARAGWLQREGAEESPLPAPPPDAGRLLQSNLPSLSKSLGEGPLHRDVALFFAESLEEEIARLHRVLAGLSQESAASRFLSDLSQRERSHLHYLRQVVLQG